MGKSKDPAYLAERKRRTIIRKNNRKDKSSTGYRRRGNGHCKHPDRNRPHSCPFQSDMNGNDDPHYCTCCDRCRHDCAMDI